ncbi:MAG: glycosyltransferase 87 family protein [Opitutaceae bacterium]
MKARLEIAEGVAHGIDVNHEQNPYSPSNALNNKPLYTVHALARLSLRASDHVVLGAFFGAAYLAWAFWLLRPKRWLEAAICILVLLSPPSLLLVERGNDDIIIYTFLLWTPILLATGRLQGKMIAWLITSLVTPIKYYPAAAYALFLHRPKSLKEFLSIFAASTTFILTLLWLIKDEFQAISGRIPSPPVNCAFGNKLLFETINKGGHVNTLLFLLGCILVGAIALWILIHPKIQNIKSCPREEHYFLLGSSIITFCFLLNGNWDYRLAFLIPTLPLTLSLLRSRQRLPQIIAAAYTSSILLTIWPEYLYFLSAIDPVQESWIFNLGHYKIVAILKHSSSWLMITFNILIACLILKPSIMKLSSDGLQFIRRN